MNDTVTVQPFQVETEKKNVLAQNAQNFLEAAQALVIETDVDYEVADDMMVKGKQREKEINEVFGPLVKKAFEAHKAIKAEQNNAIQPIEEGRRIIKQKMVDYQRAQEKKRQEEARKAEEERKRQEAERLKREEEERLQKASELEAQGKREEAEAILNAPVGVEPDPVAPVAPPAPKTKTTFKTHYTFTIADESKIPREYMIPNEKQIGAIVRATGFPAEKMIPGIKVHKTKV